MPAEGFKDHVATDGTLLGKEPESGGACGWAVEQLDYDEEMGSLHGMYGSVRAEFEVQRAIKRAELTAFSCLLNRVIGPIKVYERCGNIIAAKVKKFREDAEKERLAGIQGQWPDESPARKYLEQVKKP